VAETAKNRSLPRQAWSISPTMDQKSRTRFCGSNGLTSVCFRQSATEIDATPHSAVCMSATERSLKVSDGTSCERERGREGGRERVGRVQRRNTLCEDQVTTHNGDRNLACCVGGKWGHH
jgi:hypothetical protein